MLNILPLLVISSGSILGAIYLNKKYEEMLPLTIFSIITFLYIFYIFNMLKIGFYLVIFIAILFYTLGIKKLIHSKSRKKILKNIFTPGLICFSLITIIIYLLVRTNYIRLWDELRLWGAYPKLLFYDETIKLGKNSMLYETMQPYLPGMSLFQYFWLKCIGTYRESSLFLSYSIVGISVFMPLSIKVNWKEAWKILIILVIAITVPLTFYNSGFDYGYYYLNLFIDPIVGIIFGYVMFLSLKDVFKNKYIFMLYLFSNITLILLKDSGLMLSLISLVSLLINKFKNNGVSKEEIKGVALKFLVLFISFLLINSSWKLILYYYNLNSIGSILNLQYILSLITDISSKQREGILIFIKFLTSQSLVNSNINIFTKYMTYVNIMIGFFIITLIIRKACSKNEIKNFTTTNILLYIGNFIFVSGLLLLCLTKNNSIDSFPRYINTVMLSTVVFSSIFLLNKVLEKNNNRHLIMYLSIILLIMTFIFFPVKLSKGYDSSKINIESKETANQIIKLIDNKGIRKNIFFFGNKDYISNTLFHHRLYIELIDKNIFVKNFSTDTDPSTNYNYKEWLKYLYKNNFIYIYIYNYDAGNFIDSFSNDLGTKIKEGMIIKIIYTEGKAEFRLLNGGTSYEEVSAN